MSTYLIPRTSVTAALCAVAAALLLGAPTSQAWTPREFDVPVVPQRVDDFNRSAIPDVMWVNHVLRGSPRVDDFNTELAEHTWINHLDRGSPRVDDFDASPAR